MTFALSLRSTGAAPAVGTYTFDSEIIDGDSFAGLTSFETPIRSWTAQKGNANSPRSGSLTLDLTDPGTTTPGGEASPPHGTVAAVLVSGTSGDPDVNVTGTF